MTTVEDEQPEDDKKPNEAAQDKANDPGTSGRWRNFSAATDVAFAALLGGGTANLFLGDATVGQVGDRATASGHLGAVVRSGPVPRAELDRIRSSFVAPSRYHDLRAALDDRFLVLVHARPGSGRTTAALRLLDHLCPGGVRKLDPDADLKTLRDKDFEDDHGYLLDSLDPAQARELRLFQLDRLARLMEERGCRLVVIVDETTVLPVRDVGHLVVADLGTVGHEALVRKYLDGDAAVLDRDDVREVLAELSPDLPCRAVVDLAGLLRDVAAGRADVAAVRERYSRAGEDAFVEWFESGHDTDQRAFAIALAVFNDQPVQLVSEAGALLADMIKSVETARRSDRTRPVFGVRLDRRVADARAVLVRGTEDTEFGRVPVTKIRFTDDRYAYRLLRHLCDQYDQAYDIVREWLLRLGEIPGDQVRIRAGMAAGLLSLHDFIGIHDRVVDEWARSGDENARWAAVAALRIPGQDAGLGRVVYKMLRAWSRPAQPQALRLTAAQALGSATAMSPAACLRLLRQAARFADWDIAFAIGESMCELYCRVEDPAQVLGALVRWTHDDEHPKRRETALLAVLIMSSSVVRPDEGGGRWPALIWDAEHVPERRAQVVLLYARMLQAAEFMLRGYLALKGWVRSAQRDATLRTPLARLLHEVGAASDETDSVRHYLETWRDEHDGPADAVRDVLRHFDRRGA
ncbi:hypothetical protein GCM10022243_29740 [Saccharothrix violaceirubra]|uniref:AAA+ ATPase domain-containing protein n=1 Tax=Saccharothrix violaceirubra TaxID=413306 RepID=A0A7W7T4T4_9PSEU|nr:hypothetical protein [Saccharothrix violaceirubra]MBB4966598.1 hypothetical protein [Saccharothrix violaceirubra]